MRGTMERRPGPPPSQLRRLGQGGAPDSGLWCHGGGRPRMLTALCGSPGFPAYSLSFFCQVTLIPAPLHSCSTRSSSSCCTSWLRGSWLPWLYASKLDTRWVGGASADGSLDHLPSASKLNILGGWGAPERAQAVWMFGVCRMPFFV